MRKPIIVGNWKMNKTMAEAKAFIDSVDASVNPEAATVGVASSFIALDACKKQAKNLIIASQNVHFEKDGAFTGEISVDMLKEVEIQYCLVGHSERREMFNETDQTINSKCKVLLSNGIVPILCFGETLEQFEANETEGVVRSQLEAALVGIEEKDIVNMVLAYEPIWAIGTGKTATSQIAQDVCAIVRNQISKLYSEATASKVRIQYGGSVKPDNIEELMEQPDIDGALIGGASLDADTFISIISKIK